MIHSLLRDLLGPTANHSLAKPPPTHSTISDDHSPVEFSIALNSDRSPIIRILGEGISANPDQASSPYEANNFLKSVSNYFTLSLDRYRKIQDLFLEPNHEGEFRLWYSLVLGNNLTPSLKIYLDPNARGRWQATSLVADALQRLSLDGAYQVILAHARRPLGELDRFSHFSLDLHDRPQSRVKVYLSHHNVEVGDVIRAASAVPGIDTREISDFCALGGETEQFAGRPLISSYTFTDAESSTPSGYSLYLPIRDYVADDEEARHRVLTLLTRYGFDHTVIDRAIAAMTARPLHEGVGLIAHVSLRLSPAKPGMTVYLSSEAYAVTPPRVPAMCVTDRMSRGPMRDADRLSPA